MSFSSKLPNAQENILLALWKLGAIGGKQVSASEVKAVIPTEDSSKGFTENIDDLSRQGLLETYATDDDRTYSLTAIGLALLRQIQEDRLQELGTF